jgi:membrane associated rhomboid family serine protease
MSTIIENQDTIEPAEDESSDKNHLATTPYYTIIILTALVAVFLSQQLISMTSVVEIAGHVKPLFAKGDFWRLLTSAVVHDGIIHIGFNGYALFILGKLVETISNKANVSFIFVLSAVFGGLLSFAFLPLGSSVGASGGVIGLLGFLTVYSFRRRKLLSNEMFKSMLFNIGFIAVIGVFILPNVDNFGHLGGLLAGGLWGVFQVPDDLYVDPRDAGRALDLVGKLSLGVVLITALSTIAMIVIWYFATGDLFPYFDF